MQILVISDIHANLTALEAVLIGAGQVDAVWCLGDVVGYGPDPNECVARLRGLPNLVCLLGNHDAAALGQIDMEAFNTEARVSVQWMVRELNDASLSFLNSLEEKQVIGGVTLVHGSPRNPVWEYILDPRIAKRNFNYFDTPFCFVGHTHLPFIYQFEEEVDRLNLIAPIEDEVMDLKPRAVINPGSVGQPRDHDPRASYAIFNPDENTWEYRRASYDISSVQQRIFDAGLPSRHALRLSDGW